MTKNEIERWMSSKEAATRMGISPSTFKRMCDANDIPVIRTPGGHRRIDSSQFEVVSRLMQRKGHGTEDSIITQEEVFSLLLEADPLPLIERFYRAAPTIQRQIELIEDVFVPALWRVGDQWQRNIISVAQEKICTSTASMVLDGLTACFSTSTKRERTLVGASFASSQDTLASKIVALGLMSINVRPIFLGVVSLLSTLQNVPHWRTQKPFGYHTLMFWISNKSFVITPHCENFFQRESE